MPKITAAELQRIVDLLQRYPITEVHRRTNRSFITLARIAEVAFKEKK